MAPTIPSSRILTLVFVLIIHCSTRNGLAAGACAGIQSYKLKIAMNWTKANDRGLPEKAIVPAVFAVAHTSSFKLFEVGKTLDKATVDFVRNKTPETLDGKLRAEMKKQNNTVVHFDQFKNADRLHEIFLNVDLDGGLKATRVSFIGLVSPSPGYFFGASDIEMCNGTQFLEKFPADSNLLWTKSYDAGIIARQNATQINVSKPVSLDKRKTLVKGYATYSMTQGVFRHVPKRWRIYVIAGCVAIAAVIAVVTIAVLNHQKKKKFSAANPPPAA